MAESNQEVIEEPTEDEEYDLEAESDEVESLNDKPSPQVEVTPLKHTLKKSEQILKNTQRLPMNSK